jgi:hypothetical protein
MSNDITDSRAYSYVLKLEKVKNNLKEQIMHCQKSLNCIITVSNDPNYTSDGTELEKSNIVALQTLISSGLDVIKNIVW